jgi:hypothetical protein
MEMYPASNAFSPKPKHWIGFSRSLSVILSKTTLACFGLLALLWPKMVLSEPGYWMPEARLIQNIIVEGGPGGFALLVIQGGVQPDFIPPSCNSPYNMIDLSTSKGKGTLSIALTAYSTGKPVRLALQCIGDRPLISHIML